MALAENHNTQNVNILFLLSRVSLKRWILGLTLFCFIVSCTSKPKAVDPLDLAPREEVYPVQFWPRLYRWQMINQLQAYLDDEKNGSLYAFSWWYKKWKTQMAWEYTRANDLAYASAELEDAPTKEEFLKEFNLRYEAKVLGPLANKVLEELDLKNWREEYEKGISPLEIIATLYKSKPQKVDPTLQTEFLKRSVAVNEELDTGNQLDDIIQVLAGKSEPRYVFPHENWEVLPHEVSQTLTSFFHFPELSDVLFNKLKTPVELKGKTAQLVIPASDIWTTAQISPCGSKGPATLFVSAPRSDLSGKKLVKDGITWYCF